MVTMEADKRCYLDVQYHILAWVHSDGVEARILIGHLLMRKPSSTSRIRFNVFSDNSKLHICFSVQGHKKHGMGGARSDRLDMHAGSTYPHYISCFCVLLYLESFALYLIFPAFVFSFAVIIRQHFFLLRNDGR